MKRSLRVAEKIKTCRRLAGHIAADPYGVMGRAPATKHNDDILSSRAGNAIGKRCVRTPHGRLQRRRDRPYPNIGAGRRPSPEGLLNAFDDPVEQPRLGRRINHCEAVYEPAIAAEDHLFVEGLAVAFTGQCEPAAADSPVRDVVVRVRVRARSAPGTRRDFAGRCWAEPQRADAHCRPGRRTPGRRLPQTSAPAAERPPGSAGTLHSARYGKRPSPGRQAEPGQAPVVPTILGPEPPIECSCRTPH